MADDHPAAAAAAAAVGPNALVIAASDDAAASASCIKCRYCKVVLRQDDEVVSCDLCASVCCGKCWGQRGSRCSNSGGKGGNPCHADGAYDSWEFKIGENLEMDLAHGFVRAARGEEDRAFGWLQLIRVIRIICIIRIIIRIIRIVCIISVVRIVFILFHSSSSEESSGCILALILGYNTSTCCL